MAAFDLVIFDLDGVLVDSELLSCSCLQAMLAESGIALSLQEIYARFLGRGFQAVLDHCRRTQTKPIPGDFRGRFEAAVRSAFAAELQPMPGIRELLGSLRVPYCVASSSGAARIALSLQLAGLATSFEGRVFGAELVVHGKPAPDVFLYAAQAMGAAPERCLVIEDSDPGIAAACAAGMVAWGFTGGSHLAAEDVADRLRASGAAEVFAKMDAMQRALLGEPAA
jgi:HAD superfamily hydrolase (TIGR01509 family)